MARPVGTNAILEVTFVGLYQGSTILNVFHYRLLSASSAIFDGDLVVDAAIAKLQTDPLGAANAFRDCVNVAFELLHVRYQWIYPIRFSPLTSDNNCGGGTVVGQELPSNVAGVFLKRSIFAGPHGHGSCHMSGLSVQSVVGPVLSAEYKTDLSVFAARMDDTISLSEILSGASLAPVLYDRSSPATSALWNETQVMESVRVMRRRTLGVGI